MAKKTGLVGVSIFSAQRHGMAIYFLWSFGINQLLVRETKLFNGGRYKICLSSKRVIVWNCFFFIKVVSCSSFLIPDHARIRSATKV